MPQLPEPFHAGELAVQKRMGVRLEAMQNSALVRDDADIGSARNIARADIAVLTTRHDGRLHVDICAGPTGFIELRSPSLMRIHCDHTLPWSLIEGIQQNGFVGGLTLGFAARQRARINGVGSVVDDRTFDIDAGEVFFNCTKFITTRTRIDDDAAAVATLDLPALVAAADMFFVGSRHPKRGLDASHRGGNAGFLTFADDVLSWIEYPGNAMYQTMGNLLDHPEIAVIVPDLVTGRQVHFHGSARIDFGDAIAVTVELDAVEAGRLATTQRWSAVSPSPHNPPLGRSHGEIARVEAPHGDSGPGNGDHQQQ
jgi:uncharacterized protein